MSATALAATFAAVVAVAGCSGKSSPGGVSTGPNDSPLPSTSSSAPGARPSAAATTGASTGSTAKPGGQASTAAAGASTPTTGSSAGARKPPGKPTGFTRPGTYAYTLRGSAKQPIGGTQTVSGTQSYVVDAPHGSTQHSKTSDQQGSQDSTLEVRSSGLYVRDIHITQQGFDEDFRPSGTALYFPAGYHTGSKWSWRATSTDGKYTIAVTTKVSGSTSVTVGGQAQRALIADSTLHITGSGFDIVDNQRDWVSVKYALILKEHAVTQGKAYGASFSSDVTRQLRSTTPS